MEILSVLFGLILGFVAGSLSIWFYYRKIEQYSDEFETQKRCPDCFSLMENVEAGIMACTNPDCRHCGRCGGPMRRIEAGVFLCKDPDCVRRAEDPGDCLI